MKKYILLLFMITGFLQAQTLQNPTFGNTTTNTLKVKTPTTITSVNFLPAFDTDGLTLSKVSTDNIPLSTATINAINVQDATVVHKTGPETIQDKKTFTLSSTTEAEAAVTIKRQYSGVATNKVSVLNLVNESDTPGGQGYQNEVNLTFKAGGTENWRRYVAMLNYDGTPAWYTGANKENSWILYDVSSGLHRYWNMTTANGGHTYINSAGTGRIYLNQFNDGGTGNGTGGVYIGNGGTSPTTQWYVDNEGRMTSPANTAANLRYWQTIGGVFTDNTSSTQGGLYSSTFSSPNANGTGNVTGGTLRSVHNTAFNAASVTGIFGVGRAESSGVVGIVAGGDFSAQNAGTAVITGLYGARFGLSAGTGSTSTNGYGFYVSAPSGSGTITGYRGGRILDYTASSFTYGLELGMNSASTKWNIYASGTAKNYFNGTVLIGTTTDNGVDKLQVTGTASGSVDATLSNQFVRKGQLDLKADLASPTFTGDPKVPTATAGDSDTSAANTLFVQTAIASIDIQDIVNATTKTGTIDSGNSQVSILDGSVNNRTFSVTVSPATGGSNLNLQNTNVSLLNEITGVGSGGFIVNSSIPTIIRSKQGVGTTSISIDEPIGNSDINFQALPAGSYQVSVAKVYTDATTVVKTSATLTTDYPSALPGDKVHAVSIIAGAMIYEKTASGWVQFPVTVTP